MKTFLKFSLAFLLLIVAAMIVLPFAIDINKYKGRIESLVERQIRGKIEIGQIRFSTFPWLGVSVKGVQVKNRKAPDSTFDGGLVLGLQEVGLRVKVKSLLSGRIVAGLTLQEPKIRLARSKEGRSNLDDLLPPRTAPSPSLSEIFSSLTTNKWARRVLIEEIRLADGEIFKENLFLPIDLTLSSIQLENPSKPARLYLKTAIFDGQVTLKGSVQLKPSAPSEITIDAANLEVSKIPKAGNVVTGKGNLHLAVTGSGLDFDSLSKSLEGEGQLKLVNGKLKTMNLLTSVFSPKIAELLRGGVVGRAEEIALPGLHEEGTSYQSITMPFRFDKGQLILGETVLGQSGYEGRLQGSIGLDMTADLTGRLLFSKETSARIVPNPKVLPYVTNEERRLLIPFRITGNLKEPTVTPDGEYVKNLAANAARKALAEEGTKILQEKVAPELKKAAPEVQKEAEKILKELFR